MHGEVGHNAASEQSVGDRDGLACDTNCELHRADQVDSCTNVAHTQLGAPEPDPLDLHMSEGAAPSDAAHLATFACSERDTISHLHPHNSIQAAAPSQLQGLCWAVLCAVCCALCAVCCAVVLCAGLCSVQCGVQCAVCSVLYCAV